MSYTPPAGDAVNFRDDAGTYTPPAGDAVNFRDDATGSRIKVWISGAWVLKPLMRWDGLAWVPTVLKRWTGSAWTAVP